MKVKQDKKVLFSYGHRACSGCGETIAVKWILEATGENVIVCSPTGCLEVFSTPYPESAWNVPWIHSLFDNVAAVASGVEAGLKALGKKNETKVLCIAGDGGTFDIGMQCLSGMFERGHDVTYVCLDNEAYMNTGIQRSGATPYGAATTTTPAGKFSYGNPKPKKDMPRIASAHNIKYVATASISYVQDARKKVKKAIDIEGPTYIQIHTPCTTGWRYPPEKTIEIGRLAVETALWVLYEMENGTITKVRKIKNRKTVEEYLKLQGRFKHLFTKEGGTEEIKKIQAIADYNAKYYGLE
ncbi:MAG TPA: pyruvate synthase subunit beta [Methanosarcinales archaeon]|nr:pyruvate synthase subunit beta [Methanosarcinales archaeon]